MSTNRSAFFAPVVVVVGSILSFFVITNVWVHGRAPKQIEMVSLKDGTVCAVIDKRSIDCSEVAQEYILPQPGPAILK